MLQNTLARMRKRYEGKGASDRGQTAFEYLGIILVVVVIIGAIVGTGIGQTITAKITTQIGAITAGK
ncbi:MULTISPECIES: hypothetical protein [unclassified Streptomyces]|uniref:hypothetical protein n=1 Tax=unclassified Streptomyces TaxID=2593676 RepID=UPI00061FD094|nr:MULTISPECIES: hypothetical protein [unclassified Streptomyces]KJY47195.1 hypothetical protein VR46_04855 [Streptomyces sp. NRRL S-444]MCX4627876.1 hypothetical protein [Streptomyces sp. NBC_01443]THA37298.1 hypothetical protein E6W17_21065 [Streptomyces sp. A1547]